MHSFLYHAYHVGCRTPFCLVCYPHAADYGLKYGGIAMLSAWYCFCPMCVSSLALCAMLQCVIFSNAKRFSAGNALNFVALATV
jgi:hypothetical protein